MALKHTYTIAKVLPHSRPDLADERPVKLSPSVTYPRGTVLGWKAATDTWEAYVDAGAMDPARCILAYDVAVDASGRHFIGGATVSEQGESLLHTSAYFGGRFLASDLVGLDAAGLVDLKASIMYGDNLADPVCVIKF